MSELAFNANGDGFEVPAAVTGWRVRRMKPRGAPELVYGRDGRPLTVPIECDMDDLRAAVGTLGKYRLDPIDDNGRVIEGIPAAYVQVVKAEKPTEEVAVASHCETDSVLREALRANTELAKTVVERFPEMMHAAAELLRAADGAGLSARMPRLIKDRDDAGDDADDDDNDDDDAIDTPPGFDLNTLVAQVVPALVTGIMSGKVKMPALAALFDWRKAAPGSETTECATLTAKPKKKKRSVHAASTEIAARETAQEDSAEPSAFDGAPQLPLDPVTMAHFIAVQAALSPEEAALAREVAAQLSPGELRTWFDELSELSVADAAEKIRKVVSASKTGGEA